MLCVIKSVLGGKLIMKIVHICLCGAMTDGFNYQENVITKYHKKMGYTFLYKCVEKKNIDFNISNYRNSFVYGKMITKEAVLCDHSL